MEVVLTLLLLLLVGIGILLWRSFLPGYAREKGKNLATKQDIADITNEIERVKSLYATQLTQLEHQNERLLEELRSRQQLRMAAVEKRLETHQQVLSLRPLANNGNTR